MAVISTISIHMQLQQSAGGGTDDRDRVEANTSEMCTGMLNVFRISSGVLPAEDERVCIEALMQGCFREGSTLAMLGCRT